jgi:hypothetical protein
MNDERPSRFAALLFAALPLGCGSSAAGSPGPSASDASASDDTVVEVGADGVANDAALPEHAYLRVAHASPSMPAIDVCVAPHGTESFEGPLVGELAASFAGDAGDDAGAPGLAFAHVSAYLPLGAGQYDVRVVAAGAASCASSLTLEQGVIAAPDATGLPALAHGTHATLLLAGTVAPAATGTKASVTMLTDDAALAGGAASLRAVNAILGAPSLDFGIESAAGQWLPLLTDVSFAAASAQTSAGAGAVDANGYVSIGPWSDQTMSAHVSRSSAAIPMATTKDITIAFGSIVTVIAIGGDDGAALYPPGLLVCTDNAPSGAITSDCLSP